MGKKLCDDHECDIEFVMCAYCKQERASEDCEVEDGKVICRWCKNKQLNS